MTDTPDDELSNVVSFPGETVNDVPAEKVLEAVRKSDPDVVIAITIDKNHTMQVFTSTGDGMEILWLLEVAKQRLLNMTGQETMN